MLKNRGFNVAPKGNATDTLISYILGGMSTLFLTLSVVKSIMSKGNVERIYGVLMFSALVMSFTGTIFAVLGYYSDEGGVTSKRTAIIVNVVVLIVTGIFLLKGIA